MAVGQCRKPKRLSSATAHARRIVKMKWAGQVRQRAIEGRKVDLSRALVLYTRLKGEKKPLSNHPWAGSDAEREPTDAPASQMRPSETRGRFYGQQAPVWPLNVSTYGVSVRYPCPYFWAFLPAGHSPLFKSSALPLRPDTRSTSPVVCAEASWLSCGHVCMSACLHVWMNV